MSSTTVNFLKVRNNVDFNYTFTAYSQEGNATPALIDLSSATIFMQVKPALGGNAVIDLAVGSGITKTDPANGEFNVLVDSTVMELIEPGKYLYDIVIVRSGLSETIVEGYMKIKDGVTDL